jgi:hypothetical protein
VKSTAEWAQSALETIEPALGGRRQYHPTLFLQSAVTNLQQINGNPRENYASGRISPGIMQPDDYLASLAIRWVSRETFRRAALR